MSTLKYTHHSDSQSSYTSHNNFKAKSTIKLGGKHIGYADLLQVIQAEKQGHKIDLNKEPVSDWTHMKQLEIIEQRRLKRVQNLSTLNLKRYSGSLHK